MADGSITFSTALDNGQLEKDLKKAERDVESLKQKLAKADRSKTAIEEQLEHAKKAAEEARKAVEGLRQELGAESDSQLNEDFKKASQEAGTLRKQLDATEAKYSESAQQLDELAAKYEEARQRAKDLRAEADALEVTADANVEDQWGYHRALQQARQLRQEADTIDASLSKQEAKLDSVGQKCAELEEKANGYREQLERASQTRDDLGAKREAIQQANASLKEQENTVRRIERQWETANRNVQTHTSELEVASDRASKLGAEYGAAMGKANSASARATDAMRGAFDQIGQRINTMIRRVFVLQVALSALRSLRSMISSALMENERLSASVAGLRAAFQGVVNYVAAAVAPAIIGAVNAAASAIMWLARLVDSVFGTRISESIARAQQAAQAAWRQGNNAGRAADNLGKQGKATKKLGQETEKATKTVLGFDQINALNADDAADAADGIGDQAAGMADGGLKPDWDALDVGKIDAKLAEIMLILGAALMAVGAILAFSGINIPVGLTLMVIGALMIYAAYQEQWDLLPEKVRSAITGLLVITGIVLLVLGAVLAFSGPQGIPIGIGMMVAGALLIWTAVALNWGSMTEQMRSVVSALMVVLSLALLVIGAILTFSAANPALGVALMVVGAASLVAVAALNWNSMPQNVRSVVTAVFAILGGALLVIGAILALSGAAAPLGVGLMLAGAVMLASAAALNWSTMSDKLRDTVTRIGMFVSAALLVIGVILCFTGVGLPLGIALIAAGAIGLATAASINWDYILEQLRSAWERIRNWFNSNVANVLTSSFWAGKAKGIANGLIGALNAALQGVGWFVNAVASGINSVLSWLGVGGASFSVSMPQIPYLAEGAVIPPNREFLAVLGDQRRGNNIEAPEELMRQIVREEAGSMLADAIAALASGQTDQRDVVLMVGHTELARETVRGMRALNDTGELGRLGLAFS